MKSLFNPNDNKEILGRIDLLTADTKAEWGKMDVAKMVTHTQVPLKVAFEEVKLKRGLIGILFGRMALKQLSDDKPFKRNLPTDKNFIVTNDPDFEKEKNNLAALVQRFGKSENSLTKEAHPFFGKMTVKEWDNLMWKHLDHHLRQFGV